MHSIMSGDHRIAYNRIVCGLLETATTDAVQSYAEHLQRLPDRFSEIEELALQVARLHQQQSHRVAVVGLDMCLRAVRDKRD